MPRRTTSLRPRHAAAALGAAALATVVAVTPAGAAVARNVLRAWADVVGTDRPQPVASDEVIVVLRAPSAAQRLRPGASSRDAVRAARAAQTAAVSRLTGAGLVLQVEGRYVKTVDAVVARVRYDRRVALAASRDVVGVYPLRALVPAGVTESALGALGDGARPLRVALPGDGAGVTVALLDGPVDASHPYLGGRVTSVSQPNAAVTPAAAAHGTASAGIVTGAGGPGGLRGVAPAAHVLAIPVLQQRGDGALQGSTADLLAGLEQAADPNGDDDLADRARVVLAPLAAPYAGFADSPEARAISGISRLGSVVVAAAGDDGATGTSTGTIGSPAAAPDALAVGATDGRERLPVVPLTVHGAVETSARALALGGALAPQAGAPLALHAVGAATGHAAGSAVADYGRAARGTAVLVARDGGDLAAKARAAAAAGVRALLVYGADALPAGALGIDDRVPIPIVGVDAALGRNLAHALESRAQVQVTFGQASYTANDAQGQVAAFSSTGPLYAGDLKPDLVAPGVAIVSSLPGGAYGALTGASAAAAQAAGAVALLAAVHPDWSSARLRSALVSTAQVRAAGGSLATVTAEGGGRVDAAAAAGARLETEPATLSLGTIAAGRDATGSIVVRNPGARAAAIALGFERDGGAASSAVSLRADHPTFVLAPGAAVALHLALQASALPAAGSAAGGWLVLTVDGAAQRVPLVATVAAPPLAPLRAATLDQRVLDRAGDGATLTLLLGRVARGDAGTLRIGPVASVRIDLLRGARRLGTLYAARDVLPGRYRFTVQPRGPGGDLLAAGAYRLAVTAVGADGRASRRAFAVTVR